jgi:[FeFe] hydrogenase (group B1/B3)
MTQLAFNNKATTIRKELMAEVLKYYIEGRIGRIDEIPVRLYPKSNKPYRCCIYRDRAIVRSRIIAILGYGVEDEEETKSLAEYARDAIGREKVEEPVLTVISEACSACVTIKYYVTNACRGCVARPCKVNCPKGAIKIPEHMAEIDHEKCISCGLCQKVCPYNAIVYIPVPCEEGCPVGAISKGQDGKEAIDYKKCIYCGKCTRACPFGAITEKTQIMDVAKHMINKRETVAMMAPSIVGQFPGTLKQIITALKEAGFSKVFEVAVGADKTAQIEAKELEERISAGDLHMGTSCCPAYTEAVKKHAQEFKRYVSHAKTPMAYTAETTAEQYPDAIKVFIGPCIAKKFEGIHDKNVDYVLTYEELAAFFDAKGINPENLPETDFEGQTATIYGRGFPVSSGVGAAIKHYVKNIEVKPTLIDGLSKKGIRLLKSYGKSPAPGNLIEVMGCEGGCIYGPGVVNEPKKAAEKLKTFLEQT